MIKVPIDSSRKDMLAPYIASTCNLSYSELNLYENKVYTFVANDTLFRRFKLTSNFESFYRQYVILTSNDLQNQMLMINYTLLLNNRKLPINWKNVIGKYNGVNIIQYSVYIPLKGDANPMVQYYIRE